MKIIRLTLVLAFALISFTSNAQDSGDFLNDFIKAVKARETPKFFEGLQKANNGDKDAQFYVATCYRQGNGVEANQEKAIYWFEKAAMQDHADAQYYLAGYYFEEKTDDGNACGLLLLSRSAELGNIYAQKDLSDILYEGKIRSKDPESAFYWLVQAYNNSNDPYNYKESARVSLAVAYYEGNGTEINYSKAFNLFIESCNGDIWNDKLFGGYLGECYYYGRGTTKNLSKAFEYLNKSYDYYIKTSLTNHKKPAQFRLLASFYEKGICTDKNVAKANEIRIAANKLEAELNEDN